MAHNINHFEPSSIGKPIACLGDHRVYLYSDDSVIKFSQFDGMRTATNLKDFYLEETAHLTNTFGEYFLHTNVVTHESSKKIGLLQTFVVGRPLALSDFDDVKVRSQLAEIIKRLQSAEIEGEYIDLVGGGLHFYKSAFGNIFVTPERKLVIIDSSVLRTGDFKLYIRWAVAFVIWFGNRVQARRIRKFEAMT